MLSHNRVAARRAAALVRHRTGAGIPVNVLDVASQFADVERADWPAESVDGITVDCSSARPKIFYRGDPSGLRTRFTIAHELGHAVIAWHIGSAECAMPKGSPDRSPLEQEADHFASELLLPSDWLKKTIIRCHADLDSVLADIVTAQASATASMIALATALPMGWALQLNNQELVATHDFYRKLTRSEADGFATASGRVEVHQQTVRWWRLFEVPPLPDVPGTKASASLMLDRAWASSGEHSSGRKSLDGKISGMLGNSADVLDLETGFGYLLWRLGEEKSRLYDTPDFRSWLAWKASQRLEMV